MSIHWADRLLETRPDEDYAHLQFGDNVHVRRLADAQRHLELLRFAEPEIEAEREALLHAIRRTFERIDETQVAMVVAGDWNAGKSTLTNAFLGENWLPVNVTRETVTINRLIAGPERKIRVLFRGGFTPCESSHDYPNTEFVHRKIKELGKKHRDMIDRIDVFYPDHAFLKWVALIDTPGLDFSGADDSVSQPLIEDADALIWVMHLEGPRQADLIALRSFRQQNPGSPILAIINYADLLEEGEREDTLVDKKARLGENADAVFLVSAKNDLHARGSDPGFTKLRAYLHEHVLPAYGEMRYRRPSRLACNCLGMIHGFAERVRDRPLMAQRPYRLGAIDCWCARDVARAIASGWDATIEGLEDSCITAWLRDELQDGRLSKAVEDLLANDGLTADARLLHLQAIMAPNRTVTWRGIKLEQTYLADFARQARNDPAALASIRGMFRNGILRICSDAGHEEFGAIQAKWEAANIFCNAVLGKIKSKESSLAITSSTLNQILARLLLLQLDENMMEAMRVELQSSEYAVLGRTVSWYADLGDTETDSPEIAILLLELSAAAHREFEWNRTIMLATSNAYEDFLKRYPEGAFSDEAKRQLPHLLRKELLRDLNNPSIRRRYLSVRTTQQRDEDGSMYDILGFSFNSTLGHLSREFGPLPPGASIFESMSKDKVRNILLRESVS